MPEAQAFGSVFGTSGKAALIGGIVAALLALLPALTPLLIGTGTALGGVLAGAFTDKGFKKGLLGIAAEAKNILGVVVQPIVQAFTKLMPTIDVALENLGPLLKNLFAASTPYLGIFIKFLIQAAQVLLPIFTKSLKELTPYLPEISKGLSQLVIGLGALITAMGPHGIRASATIFVAAMTVIGGSLALIGKLANAFAEVLVRAGNHIRQTYNDYAGFAILAYHQTLQAWNAVFSFFAHFPQRFRGFFAAAGSWLVNAGRDVITGLWHGIINLVG